MSGPRALPFGAEPGPDGVHFRVWAPGHHRVDVVVYGPAAERLQPLEPEPAGYFAGYVPGVGPGAHYKFRLDGGDVFPDPASRSQPRGVHGASEVVDPRAFAWTDTGWRGVPLADAVIYELHVGTATPAGSFEGLIPVLPYYRDLGVTVLQLMPVANFPGARNWGYDGVNLFAPATAYGGPDGLKRLVDAAHGHGLGVFLDVVYNHLGPEGNYLPVFTSGRFFTDRHKTPWGDAVNYDGPDSEPVREFVLHNAVHWVREYHVDGLRLDATHAILDDSPVHLLRELAERVHAAADRPITLVAEDERNERRLITPVEQGGYGLDAVWADDLHHQLRRHTAGDREGYFASYSGSLEDIARTLRRGWFYEGAVPPHRGEPRGTSAAGLPPERFVHCLQNHDQVGNRAFGDRLSDVVEPPVYRALSALLLLSPYTPMLWMGQEWAATTPFLYFTDHPEELGRLVTQGRREEFKAFSAFRDAAARERIPDPQAPETFERSKLDWVQSRREPHAGALQLYREMLALRRGSAALRNRSRDGFAVAQVDHRGLVVRRDAANGREAVLVAVCFGADMEVGLRGQTTAAPAGGRWRLVSATEEERFGGSGEWGQLRPDTLRLDAAGAVVLRSALGSVPDVES